MAKMGSLLVANRAPATSIRQRVKYSVSRLPTRRFRPTNLSLPLVQGRAQRLNTGFRGQYAVLEVTIGSRKLADGVRVAFIVENGAPIELLEFTDPNHPGRRQQSKMLI
jgi:hypothetical protein